MVVVSNLKLGTFSKKLNLIVLRITKFINKKVALEMEKYAPKQANIITVLLVWERAFILYVFLVIKSESYKNKIHIYTSKFRKKDRFVTITFFYLSQIK